MLPQKKINGISFWLSLFSSLFQSSSYPNFFLWFNAEWMEKFFDGSLIYFFGSFLEWSCKIEGQLNSKSHLIRLVNYIFHLFISHLMKTKCCWWTLSGFTLSIYCCSYMPLSFLNVTEEKISHIRNWMLTSSCWCHKYKRKAFIELTRSRWDFFLWKFNLLIIFDIFLIIFN